MPANFARIEARQRVNGCNQDDEPTDWGRPCCDLCICAEEAASVEFDCPSCGAHIFLFGVPAVPDPPLCRVCEWIEETRGSAPVPAEVARTLNRS